MKAYRYVGMSAMRESLGRSQSVTTLICWSEGMPENADMSSHVLISGYVGM